MRQLLLLLMLLVGTTTETIARTVTAGEQYSRWIDNLSFSRAATYTVTASIP